MKTDRYGQVDEGGLIGQAGCVENLRISARRALRPAKVRGCQFASAGFTLIEIMIVVGIIGLIASMGVPTLYHMFNGKGFHNVANGVVDLCTQARAKAILSGDKTALVFYPHDRRCELIGGVPSGAIRPGGQKGAEVVFDDSITIEMLDIGMHEFKDDESAVVWFFPNGTSDEMTLVLRSDQNEWRTITLEITTGLATADGKPHF